MAKGTVLQSHFLDERKKENSKGYEKKGEMEIFKKGQIIKKKLYYGNKS